MGMRDAAQNGDDVLTVGRVQRTGGFIGEQESGMLGQGAGNRHALPFAPRQYGWPRVGTQQHADLVQRLIGASMRFFSGEAQIAQGQ